MHARAVNRAAGDTCSSSVATPAAGSHRYRGGSGRAVAPWHGGKMQ